MREHHTPRPSRVDDGARLVTRAEDVYDARPHVGRVLSGRALAWADVLRGLVVSLVTLDSTEGGTVAPAWVVVSRRDDGSEVARISAAREPGAGETLLASVRTSMGESVPRRSCAVEASTAGRCR